MVESSSLYCTVWTTNTYTAFIFFILHLGTDSALIFENEMELDQALYYMIGNSIIRIIVLDQLGEKNVKGLYDMRPTPSFHAVFGSTDQILTMYKNVSYTNYEYKL